MACCDMLFYVPRNDEYIPRDNPQKSKSSELFPRPFLETVQNTKLPKPIGHEMSIFLETVPKHSNIPKISEPLANLE